MTVMAFLPDLSHTVFHPGKEAKYEICDEDLASKKLVSGLLLELQKKFE